MNKKFILFILILSLFLFVGCGREKDNFKYRIVTTNFPCYDFARAIVGDNNEVGIKMLLKPGSEIHDFEPTPQDVIDIYDSDIFIYIGGESDSWVEGILSNIDKNKTTVIKLMDFVDLVYEESVEGMEVDEDDISFDEHIWTDPINAITIVSKLSDYVVEMDKNNRDLYKINANNYIDELINVDRKISDVVNNSVRKEIIFGDRFPLRYFVLRYGLTYYAAFPGCSSQTEASAKTISFLTDKVLEDNIPVVFKIELTSSKIAETIAEKSNSKVLTFYSAHNISLDDFNNGVTYLDLMKKNVEALKEALG